MLESGGMRNETAPVVVAVGDALLHPEAMHLAAVTGRPVIDVREPAETARHIARAFAVLIDDTFLADLTPPGEAAAAAHPGMFRIGANTGVEGVEQLIAESAFVRESFMLPAEAASLLKALGELALRTPRSAGSSTVAGAGVVLTFIGAAGGAGTSTLAAAVARTLAGKVASGSGDGLDPVLVDGQRYSGGLDLLLGVEDSVGARWDDIQIGDGNVDRGTFVRALPRTTDGIAVLTHSRSILPAQIEDVSDEDAALERAVAVLGTGGVTVVDTSPGGQMMRSDHTFIVTPAEVRAAASAALIAAQCRANSVPASVVLRHRAWSGISADDMAHVTKAEVIAEIPTLRSLTKDTELSGLPGRLPKGLAAAAEAIIGAVA